MSTLSVPTKLAYGVGQIAEATKNTAFELFLFFYYTQVLGLSGTLAGVAVFLALCVDAVTDPLVGAWSDSLQSPWGRRHPLMYAAAIPLALAFYGIFAPPTHLGQPGLFVWLTLMAILVRVAMTFYQVPHLALGAELSDDYEERTAIVGYRTACGLVGSVLLVMVSFSVFFQASPGMPNGQLNGQAYPAFAGCFALLMWGTIWWSAIGTHRQIPRLLRTTSVLPPFRLTHLYGELRGMLRNTSFRVLFLGLVIFFVMRGVQLTLGLHVATFFWALPPQAIQLVTVAIFGGLLTGVPFAKSLTRQLGKKSTFLAAILWALFFHVAVVVLRLLDGLPANGHPALPLILVGAAFLGGVGAVQAMVAGGSMIADITDEHELLTGRRQEGLFFGGLTFAAKTASGLGHMLAGLAMDLIGFPLDAAPGSVASDVVWALGLIYGPGVGVLGLLAVVVFARYALTRERLAAIQATLAQRRAAALARERGDMASR